MPDWIETECPDCGSQSNPEAITIMVVQTVEPIDLYRDDQGNVSYPGSYTDTESGEVLETDRDGTRIVCPDCGYEGDPEDWDCDDDAEPSYPDEGGYHPAECEACGSDSLRPMGALANRLWLRCEDCGWESSELDPRDDSRAGEPD